jgi:hypothetical protein
MRSVKREELAKITYLDPDAVYGRGLLLMPFWDGFNWHLWVEAPPGNFIRMQAVGAIHSNYVAKHRADESDFWIQFIEIMWQRASYPEIAEAILGIQDDFHLLGTCTAKLHHFFNTREKIGRDLLTSFVKTELEYLLTVSRSTFDLLQKVISFLWNNRITLLDAEQEAKRKSRRLPDSFTKMVLRDRHIVRPASELIDQYAVPPLLAESYSNYAKFYSSLMRARDRIMHQGKSVETIFDTEKGFCVDPKAKTFLDFPWKPEHHYNENVVSLLPWIAYVVYGTIEACNEIIISLARSIQLPEEIAPGYRVFIRDPANSPIIQLGSVASGEVIWWSDDAPMSPRVAGSPPKIVRADNELSASTRTHDNESEKT